LLLGSALLSVPGHSGITRAAGDPYGFDWTNFISGNGGGDYMQIVQADDAYASQNGLTGGSSAYSTSWGYTGGHMQLYEYINWNILPR
jgi:hypothetical protein